MKTLYKLFTAFTFIFLFTSQSSFAVLPTYELRLKNLSVHTNPVTGSDSILTFDIYLLWMNSGVSDPFEFIFNDGAIFINHAVFNGGVTYGVGNAGSFAKILGTTDLPLGNSINTNIVSFDAFRDLMQWHCPSFPVAQNFLVSTIAPGTRIFTFKLRTNAHSWSMVAPNLQFKLDDPGATTTVAYYQPSTDPKNPDDQLGVLLNDTIANHFVVESDFPLPVELQSFTSLINRNIVKLNWATATESNNHGFDIERKILNSNEWIKAGFIQGNGNSNETKYYTFTERINTGKYDYRLKQIDFNGNTEYFNLSNEVEVGIPSAYTLSQNYPNPFNPSTKIDYELPYEGKVSILLYDISGREVGNLVNEIKPAGYYSVEFNASDLSSGLYFYRINAESTGRNDFVSTKKMMLIK